MKSVWAIEQGSYSDYHVVGVFSTRAKAQLVMNALKEKYNEPSIAEWPLDPAVTALRTGLTTWNIMMLRDGTVECCEPCELTSYTLDGSFTLLRRASAPAYKGKGIEDCLNGIIWAKDKPHAIKIANEKRTQMIAENKWAV